MTIHSTDLTMSPAELAFEAEQRGFASLYLPEHTHIPTSRRTPAPTGDEQLGEEYKRTLDPFVALAAAAERTERILLGTGVALVAQHDPIVLAKTLATLDVLSGGRAVLGVGYGWNREEMESHGVDPSQRRAIVREHLLVMGALWSEEVAEFHGSHVDLEPSWAWPKPVQQPRIRTLIGGAAGPTLFAQVAELADGWMPIGGAGVAAALGDLRQAAEAAGRDPGSIDVVPFGTIPDPGKLEHYREIGIAEVVLRLPGSGRDEVLPVLDAYGEHL